MRIPGKGPGWLFDHPPMRRLALVLSALLLAHLLLAHPAEAQKAADRLRVVWRDALPDLDPTITARRGSQVLALQVWDTLIYRDPDTLQTKPLIAASWRQVDDSTMDFILRPDLRFSNGDPLTADDVAYSIAENVSHPNGEPPGGFTALAGAEVLDPTHLRVRFSQGIGLGMDYLAMLLPILPRDYRERVGDTEFAQAPIGSGPYTVRRGGDGAILLDRNELYPKDGPKARPAIGHIEIRVVPDSTTELTDLLAGNADWIWDFDPAQIAMLNAAPGLQALRADSLRIGYLAVGIAADSPLAKPLVRQAVFHALDRAALARRFGTGAVRILNAPCYPTQFGCDQAAAVRYEHDPALARQELTDAGYPNGFATVLVSSLLPAWGEILAADLRAVGIDVSVLQVASDRAAALARGGQAPLRLGAWGSAAINDAAAILPHFFAGGGADQVHDAALQAILASAISADPDRRRQADQAAIQRITAQAYMLPLNILVDTYAFTRDLNFRLPPDDLPRFYQASWR